MGGTGGRPEAEGLKEVRVGVATGGTPGCGPPPGVAVSRRPPRRSVRAHAQSGGHCHVRPSRADWPAVPRDWPELSVRRRARREPVLARRKGDSAGQPKPSRMEVLDEFDSEFPQSVTFCQLISEEDFERQAATYTERALRLLFRSLDRNPALAERVVRKGKQAECERRGLLSFLWAKVLCAVQGELNCCNSMGALEMHQRLEQLKRRIHRVYFYSQDAKKKRSKPKPKKPEPILLRDRSTSPCLLPPPATTMASMVAPSTPVYTLPRVFGPFPPLPSTSMEQLEVSRSEAKLNWTGLSSNPKSREVDLTPLVLNPGGFQFSYLARNNAHNFHCPGFPWTSACSGSASTEEMLSPSVKASIFTPPVLLKFQPVPRPKDDSENDPGSAESTPHQRDP
ncbi:uncharacterized protein LOC133075148 [Eubalaena glacialis]|uniref:uncharacterized protein LOC133075148 n=1 Tax=Eubalaena glacialis TaxID=27606 RepID=UPI002A5A4CBE|nr:uncharacterized protein LOC133075148 [Eubalaena glacialis]